MSHWKLIAWMIALLVIGAARASAEDAFQQQVIPFLKTYCQECHNAKRHEGELDLTRYTTAASLGQHFRQWENVMVFLKKGEMPPETAKQPADADKAAVLTTLKKLLAAQAHDLSGDPGVVLPRRLTGAEYNYTVRDLTGVDIRPADSFPIDPASGEGFNNTGEALVMSPNLFKKYYAAAQHVADHIALTPSGFQFAPYPVTTFADRIKLYEQALLQFYEQHDVRYEQYLAALWSYRYRPATQQAATIEQWAADHKLSAKYLRRLWDTLGDASIQEQTYLGSIRRQWNELPQPKMGEPATHPELAGKIKALADQIRRLSVALCAKETPAIVSNAGNAPIPHLERRKKSAIERDTHDANRFVEQRRLHVEYQKLQESPEIKIVIQAAHDSNQVKPGYVLVRAMNFSEQGVNNYRPEDKKNLPLLDLLQQHAPAEWKRLNPGVHPLGHAIAADTIVLSTAAPLEITVPAKALEMRKSVHFFAEATLDREHSRDAILRVAMSNRPAVSNEAGLNDASSLLADPQNPRIESLKESMAAFCRTFPNRFVYVDETRGLSAGFHLIEGLFRDDVPLCKLVLSDEQNQQLDRLWDELYFGTGMTEKMLRGFVFFERSERNFLKHADFDSFKEEDPALVRDETLARFEEVYLTRSGVKADDPRRATHPVHLFFTDIREGLKRRAAQLVEAKPIYLRQLIELAERAYRRPLTSQERTRIAQFYEAAVQQPDIGVEQAVRGVLTSLLVSPYFCCRVDVPPAGDSVKPLNDIALASRLSYLLWSSMPDDELLSIAKAGKLNDETTLRQQLHRMRQDPKVSGFALEFFGQWLRYREFLTAESVDRAVFPAFNDQLKQAMFEEPTRLVTHLIQHDLPVSDLLYGDSTLVNAPLAAHYGLPFKADAGEWQIVNDMHKHGRGGVLGMAVFLTTNSQPQRTSPVKRGFWVVHKILGEHIPAPPNDVAVLPAKETETDGKTIRQLLAMHTEEAACARCHKRFDSIGLAMEGFDPIGKSRGKDLAGRPVDNAVALPSGEQARGVPPYLKHLRASRHDEFMLTLCEKFLGYALGRSLELSDHELLETMQANLQRDGDRFATLFETVVLSPQFRNQRCQNFTLERFRSETQGK